MAYSENPLASANSQTPAVVFESPRAKKMHSNAYTADMKMAPSTPANKVMRPKMRVDR